MKAYGITIAEGANITNLAVATGTSFPSNPDEGELFFRTDTAITTKGLYCYIAGSWDRLASSESITAPTGSTLPVTANTGDLFYKNSNDGQEGLYAFDDSAWVPVASGTIPSYTITGDVTGTVDGGTDVLTLATVNSNVGSFGTADKALVLTVNGKGLTTAISATDIDIATSQVTSGTFADARIAQSSVTQHQAALDLAASQTTSGTFADARIAQSSVTQHQAALTISESQITDGALLARVGADETVTGNWTFNNPVVGVTPTTSSQLTTKQYVDNVVNGLYWKSPVRVATTADITLSGTQTIDGQSLTVGDRVLVKDQTTAADNGIYVVALGTWTRATDFDATSPIDEVNSAAVFVKNGSVNADTGWTQTAFVSTIGTDAMTFVQFSAAGAYSAGAGLTLTGTVFDVGTASTSRIVVNTNDIDLATVGTPVTASFVKPTTDSYGRVTNTTPVTTSDITSLLSYTGDVSSSGTTTTLATVNANVGTFGSAFVVPRITVNAKGLITAVTTNSPIVSGANVSGPTLNSAVVNSSLTSVGTITSGVWNGSTIDNAYLTNPSFTLGSSTITLGSTRTSLPGLTSITMSGTLTNTLATGIAPFIITSTTRVDNLNVATAGTADILTTARTINGVSFDGSTNITITAAAGTLTGSTLASGVTASSLTSVGTITTGVWTGTAIALANGGTNASLTASNGGIFYSTSTAGAILAGTSTAGQILQSGSFAAPSWSTATYPATAGVAANVLRSNGTNFLSAALAAADLSNGVTGSGAVVLANTPTLITPVIGAATGTSVNLTSTATATAFIPSGSTVPSNGVYLPSSDSVGISTSSSLRLQITSTGVIQDGAGLELGWKTVPQNSQSAAYTLVLADSGKHILHPSADTTARTFTIPANSSVAYPIGTAITFINQNSAGVITIAITTDTMRLAGAGTTGSRTLAANGIATAIKITSTEWIISGTGLT